MEILKEELSSLQTVKSKLQEKVKDQEVDIKKMREELEKKNNSTKDEEEVFKYILNFLGILEGGSKCRIFYSKFKVFKCIVFFSNLYEFHLCYVKFVGILSSVFFNMNYLLIRLFSNYERGGNYLFKLTI
jgi:dolichol kinase